MKELTPEAQKRIDQLKLQIDWWREGGFDREELQNGEWIPVEYFGWDPACTYRRKPAPKYVPWMREDADEFRGIWVRMKSDHSEQCQIARIHQSDVNFFVFGEWMSAETLLDRATKLDGTHCGKLEASE